MGFEPWVGGILSDLSYSFVNEGVLARIRKTENKPEKETLFVYDVQKKFILRSN